MAIYSPPPPLRSSQIFPRRVPAQEGVRFSCRALKYEGNGAAARLRWLSSRGFNPPTLNLNSSSLHQGQNADETESGSAAHSLWATDDGIALKHGLCVTSQTPVEQIRTVKYSED